MTTASNELDCSRADHVVLGVRHVHLRVRGEIHGAPTVFIRDPDGYAMQVYVMPQVTS
jgi:propanediol utilization protein